MKDSWSDDPWLFLCICTITLILYSLVNNILFPGCYVDAKEIKYETPINNINDDSCSMQSCSIHDKQKWEYNAPMQPSQTSDDIRQVPEGQSSGSEESFDTLEREDRP